jgi:hypothetical protein
MSSLGIVAKGDTARAGQQLKTKPPSDTALDYLPTKHSNPGRTSNTLRLLPQRSTYDD